jgi:hypothetical protein
MRFGPETVLLELCRAWSGISRCCLGPCQIGCNAAQDKGLAAIERLDKSLDEFARLLDDKDKQDVPIKQQEALGFVGAVEEAMVSGFPYEVPKQYAGLPQLKARAAPAGRAVHAARGWEAWCVLPWVWLRSWWQWRCRTRWAGSGARLPAAQGLGACCVRSVRMSS